MKIGFYLFPDFQLLDLSGPLAVFQAARQLNNDASYKLHIMSATGGMVKSCVGVELHTIPVNSVRLDTLLICGGIGALPADKQDPAIIRLADLSHNLKRIGSICTGAFILGAMGLLDGRKATTHWQYVAELQKRYPQAKVDGNSIFIQDGKVWSSAGIASGIDLALAMVEADFDQNLSLKVAQNLVVYQKRIGGQSQFSPLLQMEPPSDRIRQVMIYAREHLTDALTVESLANHACLSPRQFSRVFKQETGESPARAIERLRIEVARSLLENSKEQIDQIALRVGFIQPERMRRAFLRHLGQTPQMIRRLGWRNQTNVALRSSSR